MASRDASTNKTLACEETTPLIRHDSQSQASTSPFYQWRWRRYPWQFSVFLMALFLVFIEAGSNGATIPLRRLYESRVCARHYLIHDPSAILPDGSVPERLCKIDAVQDELVMITSLQTFWDCIPSILLTVPYGMMADKYGRRVVMLLVTLGFWLYNGWWLVIGAFATDMRLSWLASLFTIIGGGQTVANATIFTMLADLVSADKRTILFMWFHGLSITSDLLAVTYSSALMGGNPWLPLLIAFIIQSLAFLPLIAMPETLSREVGRPLVEEDSPSDITQAQSPETPFASILHTISTRARYARESMSFLSRDISLCILVGSFFLNRFGLTVWSIMLNYVSKRYDWLIREVGIVLALHQIVQLVLLFVIIPGLTALAIRYLHLAPHVTDFHIAYGSVFFLGTGMMFIGLAPSAGLMITGVIVETLGAGYGAAARSLATWLMGENSADIGRLFAAMGVVDSIGGLTAGPVISLAFHEGMKIGHGWIGLPFLMCAGLYAIVGLVLMMVRTEGRKTLVEDAE